MVIHRDIYLNKLISKKHNGLIKVITGVRRCGKSYLLFNLFKDHLIETGIPEDHIIEIAFDSYEHKKYRDPEVVYQYLKEQISDKGMYYILLDEVQLLDDFADSGVVFVKASSNYFANNRGVSKCASRGISCHLPMS